MPKTVTVLRRLTVPEVFADLFEDSEAIEQVLEILAQPSLSQARPIQSQREEQEEQQPYIAPWD